MRTRRISCEQFLCSIQMSFTHASSVSYTMVKKKQTFSKSGTSSFDRKFSEYYLVFFLYWCLSVMKSSLVQSLKVSSVRSIMRRPEKCTQNNRGIFFRRKSACLCCYLKISELVARDIFPVTTFICHQLHANFVRLSAQVFTDPKTAIPHSE